MNHSKRKLTDVEMFLLSILVLSAGCALAHAQYDMIPHEVLFERFIQDYNKVYRNHHEKQMRFEIFKETLRKINESNRKHGYEVMGINSFADLTREELKSKLGLDYEVGKGSICSKGKIWTSFEPPESFDWRDKGVVSEVKDQKNCGSCWAFSTISNIESQYAIKHGNVVQLSEQQLVDCDNSDNHCRGGRMDFAIWYLMNTGAESEEAYPYEGVANQCRLDTSKVIVNVTGCTDYSIQSANDEETLKAALVQNGPLTIALAAYPFLHYQGGVFEHCDASAKIDHALVLEGYGTDQATGKPYWIIRNSWASSWGEGGYLRIVRGNPACQVGQHFVVSGQVA